MMSKPARLADVARRSQVSLTTVSLVLREKPGIRPETRERVIAAAQALGYQSPSVSQAALSQAALSQTVPNQHGGDRERHSMSFRTLGVLIKTTADQVSGFNAFYSYVVAGIEEECRRKRINLLYATLSVDENNLPVDLPIVLTEEQVEGLLLVGAFLDETLQRVLVTQSVPVVLVDAYSDFSYDSVVSDNHKGAHHAVTHLVQCGHRHIGIVGSRPNAYPSIRERREGYLAALREHGIRETYFADCALDSDEAARAAHELLTAHPHITAIFGCNDDMAIAAMHSAQALGKRVPEDLSIVGFDDIDLAQHVTPALTTMRVDKIGMGRLAVQLLRNRAQHPDAERVTALVMPRLIERHSVCQI